MGQNLWISKSAKLRSACLVKGHSIATPLSDKIKCMILSCIPNVDVLLSVLPGPLIGLAAFNLCHRRGKYSAQNGFFWYQENSLVKHQLVI
jgi:hypothetical protein